MIPNWHTILLSSVLLSLLVPDGFSLQIAEAEMFSTTAWGQKDTERIAHLTLRAPRSADDGVALVVDAAARRAAAHEYQASLRGAWRKALQNDPALEQWRRSAEAFILSNWKSYRQSAADNRIGALAYDWQRSALAGAFALDALDSALASGFFPVEEGRVYFLGDHPLAPTRIRFDPHVGGRARSAWEALRGISASNDQEVVEWQRRAGGLFDASSPPQFVSLTVRRAGLTLTVTASAIGADYAPRLSAIGEVTGRMEDGVEVPEAAQRRLNRTQLSQEALQALRALDPASPMEECERLEALASGSASLPVREALIAMAQQSGFRCAGWIPQAPLDTLISAVSDDRTLDLKSWLVAAGEDIHELRFDEVDGEIWFGPRFPTEAIRRQLPPSAWSAFLSRASENRTVTARHLLQLAQTVDSDVGANPMLKRLLRAIGNESFGFSQLHLLRPLHRRLEETHGETIIPVVELRPQEFRAVLEAIKFNRLLLEPFGSHGISPASGAITPSTVRSAHLLINAGPKRSILVRSVSGTVQGPYDLGLLNRDFDEGTVFSIVEQNHLTALVQFNSDHTLPLFELVDTQIARQSEWLPKSRLADILL